MNPARREDIERADVRIVVEATTNTKAMTSIDPARQALARALRSELRDRYLERAMSGELRWVLSAYPTSAAAQDAEMSLSEYEEFIYGAAFLDDGDPVARWREFAERLQAKADFLAGKQELRIVAEDTDLTMAVGGPHVDRRRRPRELPGRRGLHRARWRRAPRARSASRSRPSSGAARWTTCGSASTTARSSRRRASRARTSSTR